MPIPLKIWALYASRAMPVSDRDTADACPSGGRQHRHRRIAISLVILFYSAAVRVTGSVWIPTICITALTVPSIPSVICAVIAVSPDPQVAV